MEVKLLYLICRILLVIAKILYYENNKDLNGEIESLDNAVRETHYF